MLLIKICICLSYFIIGGLATTNIIRLQKGSTMGIFASECRCPHCDTKISAVNQTPVISYIINKGQCRQCKNPIPVSALILEIAVFAGMTVISAVGGFSPLAVLLSFAYYEVVRIVCILKNGRREKGFMKQYFYAVLAMLSYLLLVEFLSLLLYSF